ncbi:hypothetical protein CGGC5_v012934 [Colletotrichum fructicola Nara gc5]|uniref:Uncharacterized protein n=1 Tax=Colletotrichum fructicola (strain Nara gc5) TaxID=1213859 RepID=A0A7J6IT71_COLFN|nr:hypothetical protein CFRS1_v001472 [Colletotrichum fructicola]KAF4479888.1 hypothetical protein CGGC5_v012934 [Colletotrichum fructicola Nara gc5]
MAGSPTTPTVITMDSPSADDASSNDRGSDRGGDRGRQQRTTTTEDDDRGGTVIEKFTGFATLPRELILEIVQLCIPTYRPDLKQDVAQLSAVNKSLRMMCIPTLFTIVQMRTNHHRFSRLVRGIEGSDVLRAIQGWARATGRESPARSKGGGSGSSLWIFAPGVSLDTGCSVYSVWQRITVPSVTKFDHFAESTTHFIPTVFTGLNALHLTVTMGKSPKTIPGLSTIASKLNLHTLSLCKFGWQAKDFDEIYDLFPGVTKLILGTVLPVFERFKKLEILGLTDIFDFTIEDVMTNLLDEEGDCVCDCCLGDDPCNIDTNCSCDECHYNDENYERSHEMAQHNLFMSMEEDQVENATSLFVECPRLETVYFQLRNDDYSTCYRPIKDDKVNVDTVTINEYEDWPQIFTDFYY